MSLFKGFLPKSAIVMARRRGTQAPETRQSTDSFALLGEGNPQAQLFFIGEDSFGEKAGELLDRMIEAMGLRSEQFFLSRIVVGGTEGSLPLDKIEPKVIVALGKAAQTLLESQTPVSQLRGQLHPYRGAKLMATHDPAFLLDHPECKREAWADLKAVAQELGLSLPQKS